MRLSDASCTYWPRGPKAQAAICNAGSSYLWLRHGTAQSSRGCPSPPGIRDTPTCGGLRQRWTHITEVCGDVVGPHNVCMAQPLAQLGPQQMAALQGSCAVPMDTVQDLQGYQRLKAKQQSPCCYAAAGSSGS